LPFAHVAIDHSGRCLEAFHYSSVASGQLQRGQTGVTRFCCVRGMGDRAYGRESGGKHGTLVMPVSTGVILSLFCDNEDEWKPRKGKHPCDVFSGAA